MLRYLLKRLLLILPTVWLIGSLVFLLSKIIPGSYADRAAETAQATVGGANLVLTRSLYLQQLRAAGQDKPLFYFSITTLAQPDTLFRVFPAQHQALLQRLLNRYGNWPQVAAYYQSIRALQPDQNLADKNFTTPHLQCKANQLLKTDNPSEIAYLLNPSKSGIAANNEKLSQVRLRFAEMQQQAKPYNLFIPDYRWHGLQNQYHLWLTELLQGNFGKSYLDQQPVLAKMGQAIGNTILLLTISLILTFLLSIVLSLVLTRWRTGRKIVLILMYILDSIPLFITAMLLLSLLIGTGFVDLGAIFYLEAEAYLYKGTFDLYLYRLSRLMLPTLCLVLAGMPYVTTQSYQTLQQVLKAEFVKTARAKGLSENQVLRKHAFLNALLPLITLFTGYLPVLISGVVVIEIIFNQPGTGLLLTKSIMNRDYPVIIGLVLFLAALKAFTHVLADILYFAADPRTRLNTT